VCRQHSRLAGTVIASAARLVRRVRDADASAAVSDTEPISDLRDAFTARRTTSPSAVRRGSPQAFAEHRRRSASASVRRGGKRLQHPEILDGLVAWACFLLEECDQLLELFDDAGSSRAPARSPSIAARHAAADPLVQSQPLLVRDPPSVVNEEVAGSRAERAPARAGGGRRESRGFAVRPRRIAMRSDALFVRGAPPAWRRRPSLLVARVSEHAAQSEDGLSKSRRDSRRRSLWPGEVA